MVSPTYRSFIYRSFTAAGRLVVLLLAASHMAALRADEPPAKAEEQEAARIEALVAQLGSNDFTQREAASDELTRAGVRAFAALEAAAAHPDREVRYRSIRVLGQIREIDLKRRLEAFLGGNDDDAEYPLPGWDRFRKAYGDESASRKLFVEMTRADAELLRSLAESPRAAAEALASQATAQQQAMQLGAGQMSLGQVAVMLFIAAESDVTLPAPTLNLVFNFCHQQALRESLASGDKNSVPRKMVGSLIRRSESWATYTALNLAIVYGLDEGMVPAVKVLEGGDQQAAHITQYALITVARFGDRSHLPLVEKLLADTKVFTRMQENKSIYEVQIRDAALAAAIILSKQDLKTYFVGRPDQQWTDPQQVFFNPRLIGFENDEQRTAAHKKWAEFKEKPSEAPETRKP
jgi:hypothetical protein